ncbi:transglutaminase TgpA family protein [Streptacidiphilus fuscans]|uniref:Transglutaminase domain-containing protein n=1 Tax=Streptacidiphilus fuscans TaxID=2789292 RepID=A0A931B677_9ACTN|nr:DUF3488 and transglutaminase-like domain-containing protein [Streptacidiphilus fuscans]MBF9070993.1 transglutaminase domain-containing protein [Streptacidiphilus fuscans]
MNTRTRIALTAAAATVLTALCLFPLVQPTSWLVEATAMLLVITGVGVLTRRFPLARPLTVLLQLLVAVMLLTFFFVRDSAVFGLLPGPGAWRAFGSDLQSGFDDMSHFSTPAPDTVGLRLLLTIAVLTVGLLVDAMAVTYQRVALAGLPLLALYAVGTGIHPHGALWFWFLAATFGFLMLLLAEGRDRVSRWGRIFHGASATAVADSTNPVNATGLRIASLAAVGALIVPVLLPSVGSGVVADLGGGGGSGTGNGVITAVDPMASLAQSLNQTSAVPVLSYRTTASDPADQYLRIVDLDVFNGVAWTTSTHRAVPLPDPLGVPTELSGGIQQQTVETEVTTQPGYVQQWLPMPYPAVNVQVVGDWRWEPEGRTVIGGTDAQNAGGLDYTVTSLSLHPTQDQLRNAGPPPADIARTYLTLPSNLPAVVGQDARAVTANAPTAFDKALALQDWFAHSGGFTYNTNVPVSNTSNALADFLKNKQGFCVHFASTMAAMARLLGIPARVAVGFTPGTEQADGSWLVTTKNAHAWPELYFTGVGWVRFEPTPSIGFEPSFGASTTQPAPGPSSSAQPTAGAGPTAGTHNQGCPIQARREGLCSAATTPGGSVSTGSSAAGSLRLAVWALAGLVVLLLLVPMVWRWRSRRVRLARGPGGLTEQQVLDAWHEMLDTAWDLGIPPDHAETPRRTAERISALGELGPEPSAAAGRLALATEQVLYAPVVTVPLQLRQDVRSVRQGLSARVDRRTRLRAVLLPPSSSRLYRDLPRRVSAEVRRRAAALWSRLRPGGSR